MTTTAAAVREVPMAGVYDPAMMRFSVVVAMCALCGCAASINRVDPHWDGTTEPACTDSYGPVVADVLVSALGVGLAGAAADSDPQAKSDSAGAAVAIGAVVGIAFAISAGIGEGAVADCRIAKIQWRAGVIAQQRDNAAIARLRPDLGYPPSPPMAPPPPPGIEPTGWFCATSSTRPVASLCVRELAECQRQRGKSNEPLTLCQSADTAWCAETSEGAQYCAPSEDDCAVRRKHVPGAGGCEMRR